MGILLKVLPDYSRYIISSDGSVWDNKLGRYLPTQLSEDGYVKITLRGDTGKRKTFSVHRLVALSFIENLENKPTVNHIDGNKLNNTHTNLEWATRSEQTQHAWDNNLITNMNKRKQGIREKQGKKVICITTGEIFNSLGEAAETKGLRKANLSKVCNKAPQCKTAGKLPDGTKLEWSFYESN